MNDFGSNVAKSWLYRLPDQIAPIPSYETREDGMIVIFLIFQPRPGLPFNNEYIVKSACHARRTWIINSDAVDFGVPCKFYVEESEKDALLPIFEQNSIDTDRDVIYFRCPDDSAPPCNKRDHHRKKMSFIKDSRFEDYKWMLISDSDLFISRGSDWNGQKLPIFEKLTDHKPNYGILRIAPGSQDSVEKWMNRVDVGDFEINREAWFGIIESLVTPEHLKKIKDNPVDLISSAASLHAFPSRHFMKEKKADCEWLYNAAQQLDSDETVMAIYEKGGADLWDFHRELEIPVVYHNHQDAMNQHLLYLTHPIGQRKESGENEELCFRQSISTLEGALDAGPN